MPMGKGIQAAGSSSSVPKPAWIDLPRDLTANILRRLGPEEILESAQRVCTTWRNVCSEPSLWRVIKMCSDEYDFYFKRPDKVCRRAVDRSLGELIVITIKHFGTDELLQYISDRSSNLKSLSLVSCDLISPEGLMTAIKNFSRLEELHICFLRLDFDFDIETIGISCPLLKSFLFNKQSHMLSEMRIISNIHAMSIAKTMPNLCRLGLVANRLSNDGLKAILDSCLNLQSLDLRLCFNVDIESDLWKRCAERIKVLRCSPTSTWDDYRWSDDNMIYVDDDDYYWYCDNDFNNSDAD